MYGIPNMKLPKSVVRRRIDLMTEEGVTFVCGVDASEGAVAKRLLAEYDAVILCCGAGAPRPLGLDTTGISGVCYGTEYLKAAVERAQFGKAEAAVPSASGWMWLSSALAIPPATVWPPPCGKAAAP